MNSIVSSNFETTSGNILRRDRSTHEQVAAMVSENNILRNEVNNDDFAVRLFYYFISYIN